MKSTRFLILFLLLFLFACNEATTSTENTTSTTRTTVETTTNNYFEEVSTAIQAFYQAYLSADTLSMSLDMQVDLDFLGDQQQVESSIMLEIDNLNEYYHVLIDSETEQDEMIAYKQELNWRVIQINQQIAIESIYSNLEMQQIMTSSNDLLDIEDNIFLLTPFYADYNKIGDRYYLRFSLYELYIYEQDLFDQLGLSEPIALLDTRNSQVLMTYQFSNDFQSLDLSLNIGSYLVSGDASVELQLTGTYSINQAVETKIVPRSAYYFTGMLNPEDCSYVYQYDEVANLYLNTTTTNSRYYLCHFESGDYQLSSSVIDYDIINLSIYDQAMSLIDDDGSFTINTSGDYYLQFTNSGNARYTSISFDKLN